MVTIDRNSYEMRVQERNSETYPGLPGFYVFHTFYATVEGLPEGDFCSSEVDEYADSDLMKNNMEVSRMVKNNMEDSEYQGII